MAAYIDNVQIPFGNMIMSHLTADDIDELHEFAEMLGLQRRWFQDKRIYHYDVSEGKRQLAIKLGAIPEDIWDDNEESLKRLRVLGRRGAVRQRALQKLARKRGNS